MTDYEVSTRVTFLLQCDSPEFNSLLFPDIQKQFVSHVQSVYEQDSTLGDGYVQGDLNFSFQGNRTVHLDYVFQCHDANEAEAESFSRYCVNGVKKELEAFGCRIIGIDCKAGEMDMSWLDRFEDAVFGPRDSAQKQPPMEDRSGKKTASKKKNSRQER